MRKLMILLICLLIPAFALADVTVNAPNGVLHPGKAVILAFESTEEDTALISLQDDSGNEIIRIVEEFPVQTGLNRLYWNGTFNGNVAPEGDWQLTVTLAGSDSASAPMSIGSAAPVISEIILPDTLDVRKETAFSVKLSQDAEVLAVLEQEENTLELAREAVKAGTAELTILSGSIGEDFSNGDATIVLSAVNTEGVTSTAEYIDISLSGIGAATPVIGDPVVQTTMKEEAGEQEDEEPAIIEAAISTPGGEHGFTPSYGSPYDPAADDISYWNTPMDINDTASVWAALTAPITVVSTGSKCTEKTQVTIRSEPASDATGVGVVTCLTQAVRVIRQEDDWSLIECYSSSFHDSKIKKWNMLVQGWVKTEYLKTVTPSQKMGFVIDKLTQRLYIFVDGELYDTLLISTGVANAKQPYNETRSGEFILTSKVGEFASDNLKCSLAIRFNGGDLLHEVPHTVNKDGTKNYTAAENKLGTRASHGCIRVQRRKTSKGTNMQWIWNNIDKRCKLFIWEDWQGRTYPYPEDDTPLYYNPSGGEFYHTAETCYMAKNKTFSPFTYGELDDSAYASLKRCTYCTAPLRKAEIDKINEQYVPGGDHDPILTEARSKTWK